MLGTRSRRNFSRNYRRAPEINSPAITITLRLIPLNLKEVRSTAHAWIIGAYELLYF